MSDSLVERLRALAEHQDALGGAGYVLPKQRAMLREAADQIEADAARIKQLEDAAEMLWVVLANVSGGDWTKQSTDWQEAAARWRDNYFKAAKLVAGDDH